MDFLKSPSENTNELKQKIQKLVVHPDDLRVFLNDNGIWILDMLFDVISTSHSFENSVLCESFFILSNLAWADVIQERFIKPSIDLYLSKDDKLLRQEIMHFLTNIYYDQEYFYQKLIDYGFYKCLPIYIQESNNSIRLEHGYIENDKNEVQILLEMLKLYAKHNSEYNAETMDTWHALFAVCSNLSFNDIHDYKLIECAREMYFKYKDASQLHNEIMFFLRNVHIDDNVPDFDKYANHFISKYKGVYDDTIIDIVEIYKCIEFIPSILDVVVKLLAENLNNTTNYNRIIKFYRGIEDIRDGGVSVNYICNHPVSKQMIQNSVQSGMRVYILSRAYSYLTSHRQTEIPCQFYYEQFIVHYEKNEIYPLYMLFSLSNILAVEENYSFVDLNIVTKLLRTCFNHYTDDSKLYTNIFHIIANLYDNGYLHHCLRDSEFINAFQSWMCEIEYSDYMDNINDAYNTIECICKAISQHDDLYYIFNADFTRIVLTIASKTQLLHNVERYFNCTLAQKCALFLYKKNKINMDELKALDVDIYLVA